MRMRRSFFTPLLFLASLLLWAGCDETVNPFAEEDRFYTVFGYLDTAADEQLLRVIELRTEFADAGDRSIDARVTTTEVETAAVTEWRDTVVEFNDGTIGHIFIGEFQPVPGWSYILNVTRSDGRTATATTVIPPLGNVLLEEPVFGFSGITQKVIWPDVDFIPFRVEVWYRILDTSRPSLPFKNAVVVYGDAHGKVGKMTPEGWEVLVRYTEDKKDVADELGLSEGFQPILMSMGMRLTMTDGAWRPPDGVFDKEILVQPGTFSNVEQGFGFFGSVNQFAFEWTLDHDATSRAGFTFPGKR